MVNYSVRYLCTCDDYHKFLDVKGSTPKTSGVRDKFASTVLLWTFHPDESWCLVYSCYHVPPRLVMVNCCVRYSYRQLALSECSTPQTSTARDPFETVILCVFPPRLLLPVILLSCALWWLSPLVSVLSPTAAMVKSGESLVMYKLSLFCFLCSEYYSTLSSYSL